jgi:hypothetical protein
MMVESMRAVARNSVQIDNVAAAPDREVFF